MPNTDDRSIARSRIVDGCYSGATSCEEADTESRRDRARAGSGLGNHALTERRNGFSLARGWQHHGSIVLRVDEEGGCKEGEKKNSFHNLARQPLLRR